MTGAGDEAANDRTDDAGERSATERSTAPGDGRTTPDAADAGPGAGDADADAADAEAKSGGAADTGDTGAESGDAEAKSGGAEADAVDAGADATDIEELRERVEEAYDFEDFGPRDMAEMSAEEWEVAFDADSWITGEQLLDRAEADLRDRIADREVFAVLERIDGSNPRLVAYSDAGYAVVHVDGTVEGEGTVLRDVKPSVALASMPEYEVPEPPADAGLPAPDEVPEGGSDLGNLVLLVVGLALLACGLVLLGAVVVGSLGSGGLLAIVAGLAFVVVAVVLFVTVANARLSGRFRAEEYRQRLRAAGVDADERPEFLPVDDAEFED